MSSRDYDKLAVIADQSIKERDFWLKKLSGNLQKSSFPYDDKNQAAGDPSAGMEAVKLNFSGKLFSTFMKLSKGSDTKLHMILAAVSTALLAKYSGNNDIITGTPIYKQDIEIEFINTVLILRNQIHEETTFKELLFQVRQTLIEAAEHQNYPLEILLNQLGLPYDRTKNQCPLFDVLLLLENIHDKTYTRDISYNILFSFKRTAEHIEGTLEYNSRLYERRTIERVFAHFHRLAQEVLFNVESRILAVDILSEEEKRQILYDFNDPETAYPQDKTIHGLFEEQARKTPDNIALVSRELLHDWHLTYGELNKKAGRLAGFLRNRGIKPDTIAALMVEKSLEMMVGILAILKAGGAYLPIDMEYPPARIEYMLKESKAKFLLTYGNTTLPKREEKKNPEFEIELIDIFSAPVYEGEAADVSDTNRLKDAAYIIYTSGSTGKPKGVVVEHRNVIAYLNAFYREFEMTSRDTALQQASCSFDVFVEEVYPTLLRGGKIAVCPKYVLMDGKELSAFIFNHHITFISVSPLLLNEIDKLSHPNHIRIFISGGDVLKKEYATNLLKSGNSCVYNTYGPTETTVCATYHKCSPGDGANLPIGKPITNYNVYILDKQNRLLPLGVPGELWIGGAGVTRGYLNNPGLTAERFIYSSYPSYLSYPAKKLYKTGDLCRWLSDGNIEFLGRIDYQVKIRGYRIELAEIENRLLQHEDIDAALVLVKEKDTGEGGAQRFLCAYTASGGGVFIHELREYLAKYLPGYMIPSHFVLLAKMPLTPNGKPDVNVLDSYEPVSGTGAEFTAPVTGTEIIIAGIWKELLKVDKVSIHDNFFDIGGNSMLLLKAANKIRETLNKEVPYVAMFQYTTIHSLSGYLSPATGGETGTADSDKYVEQAETLNRGKTRMKKFIRRAKVGENG